MKIKIRKNNTCKLGWLVIVFGLFLGASISLFLIIDGIIFICYSIKNNSVYCLVFGFLQIVLSEAGYVVSLCFLKLGNFLINRR